LSKEKVVAMSPICSPKNSKMCHLQSKMADFTSYAVHCK
jgi:hypothetical protein